MQYFILSSCAVHSQYHTSLIPLSISKHYFHKQLSYQRLSVTQTLIIFSRFTLYKEPRYLYAIIMLCLRLNNIGHDTITSHEDQRAAKKSLKHSKHSFKLDMQQPLLGDFQRFFTIMYLHIFTDNSVSTVAFSLRFFSLAR